MLKSFFTRVDRVAPTDAAEAVRSGKALLVDVREPGEWRSGVAAQAALLPLSDLTGGRKLWKPFLEAARGRDVLVYCAAGGRSGIAARILAAEGIHASDTGALGSWKAAGWPVVKPGAADDSRGKDAR